MEHRKPQKKTGNLKDDALFLLNDEIQSKNYEHIENIKVDGKYEKTIIECKKWRSLIKIVVGSNIIVL